MTSLFEFTGAYTLPWSFFSFSKLAPVSEEWGALQTSLCTGLSPGFYSLRTSLSHRCEGRLDCYQFLESSRFFPGSVQLPRPTKGTRRVGICCGGTRTGGFSSLVLATTAFFLLPMLLVVCLARGQHYSITCFLNPCIPAIRLSPALFLTPSDASHQRSRHSLSTRNMGARYARNMSVRGTRGAKNCSAPEPHHEACLDSECFCRR